MAGVYDRLNPPRTTNGQYKGDKSSTQSEPPGAEQSGDEATQSVPETATAEPAKPAIVPRPQSYSSDLDDWWNALPPERQEFLSKREGEATKKITELGEKAKHAEVYGSVMEPFRAIAAKNQVSEVEVAKRFIAADEYLQRDPVSALQWLAQSYGVDLSKLYAPVSYDGTPGSPQLAELTQSLSAAQKQIGDLTNRLGQRETNETKSYLAALGARIEEFAKGKDYWPDVENDIAAQIYALKVSHPERAGDVEWLLNEAHTRAVKLNDQIAGKLSEAKRKADAERNSAEDKRKAEDAKRLASLNVRSKPGSGPSSSSKTMEQEMEEVYEHAQARG